MRSVENEASRGSDVKLGLCYSGPATQTVYLSKYSQWAL